MVIYLPIAMMTSKRRTTMTITTVAETPEGATVGSEPIQCSLLLLRQPNVVVAEGDWCCWVN